MLKYAKYIEFIHETKGRTGILWLLLGAIVAVLIYLVLLVVYVNFIVPQAFEGDMNSNTFGATAFSASAILLSFGFVTLGIWVAARFIHNQNFIDLFGPTQLFKRDFHRTLIGTLPVVALVAFAIWYFDEATLSRPFDIWLLSLPLSLMLVLIQTSAEEIAFRGYIQSQLAALNLPAWVWMIVPSILFGSLHYDPDIAKDAAIWIALWAAAFGFLAADLTARSGNLAAAIVFHFVNNTIAALWVGLRDYFDGLALFKSSYSVNDTDILIQQLLSIDALFMIILYVALRLRLRA